MYTLIGSTLLSSVDVSMKVLFVFYVDSNFPLCNIVLLSSMCYEVYELDARSECGQTCPATLFCRHNVVCIRLVLLYLLVSDRFSK